MESVAYGVNYIADSSLNIKLELFRDTQLRYSLRVAFIKVFCKVLNYKK